MTLDVLDFIPQKGGNPDAIKESQRKRGNSVEVVDEVIALYDLWVKRMRCIAFCCYFIYLFWGDFMQRISS